MPPDPICWTIAILIIASVISFIYYFWDTRKGHKSKKTKIIKLNKKKILASATIGGIAIMLMERYLRLSHWFAIDFDMTSYNPILPIFSCGGLVLYVVVTWLKARDVVYFWFVAVMWFIMNIFFTYGIIITYWAN